MCISYTVDDAQAWFIRMKATSKKRTPSIVNLTVKRRYLTEREVERLMDCARKYGRYGHRVATMILVAYRRRSPSSGKDRQSPLAPACRRAATRFLDRYTGTVELRTLPSRLAGGSVTGLSEVQHPTAIEGSVASLRLDDAAMRRPHERHTRLRIQQPNCENRPKISVISWQPGFASRGFANVNAPSFGSNSPRGVRQTHDRCAPSCPSRSEPLPARRSACISTQGPDSAIRQSL